MKKFLVALDNSKASTHVLATAVRLATQQGAELFLLRAYSIPVDVPMDIYYRPQDDLSVVLHKENTKELEKLAAEVPSGIKHKSLVEMGIPWQVICETATKEQVDMIIMGAHGYRFYERMLGTTASRVINHADVSVLVVRTKEMMKARS